MSNEKHTADAQIQLDTHQLLGFSQIARVTASSATTDACGRTNADTEPIPASHVARLLSKVGAAETE